MKYSLLAAALATLALTACDQMKEHKPGEGKPGQYPPSLWEKREGQISDEDIKKAAEEAGGAAAPAPAPATDPAAPPAATGADAAAPAPGK